LSIISVQEYAEHSEYFSLSLLHFIWLYVIQITVSAKLFMYNLGHSPSKEWVTQDGQGRTRKGADPGRGDRWIVLDVGSRDGFVEDCGLIFKSKKTGTVQHFHGTQIVAL